MNMIIANSTPAFPPSHPGDLLADIIPATGKNLTQIAKMLNISRQHLHAIIANRRPVSPEVAAKLGKLFGDGADIWLKMQASYDAWHAERDVDTSNIPTLRVA